MGHVPPYGCTWRRSLVVPACLRMAGQEPASDGVRGLGTWRADWSSGEVQEVNSSGRGLLSASYTHAHGRALQVRAD